MVVVAENSVVVQLTDLPSRLLAQPGMDDVLARLREGHDATIDGAWGSSATLAAVAFSQQAPNSILVVLAHEKDVDEFAADAAAFGVETQSFPAWSALPRELSIIDPILGNRLRILRAFESDAPPKIVVTTIQALLQPVPSRAARSVASQTLTVGTELDLQELTKWLVEHGFERVTAIELPGEFSIHGGIVDVFSPDTSDPFRIELFGDEIESIRLFNVESQRKVKDLSEIVVSIVTPMSTDVVETGEISIGVQSTKKSADSSALSNLNASALDSLPHGAWVVLLDLAEIVNEGKRYLDRMADPRGLFTVSSTLERCTRQPYVSMAPLLAESGSPTCHLKIESIERFGGPKGEALQELARVVQQDETVLIACHNEAARMRLSELMSEVFLGGDDNATTENRDGPSSPDNSGNATSKTTDPKKRRSKQSPPEAKTATPAASVKILPPLPALPASRAVMDAAAGGGS